MATAFYAEDFVERQIVCFLLFTEGSQGPLESKSGIQIKLYCVHTK